jgi:hypothetical protein
LCEGILTAVARVDLGLEPTEGTHIALSECAEERHERVKLTTLDVDPEDVDELLFIEIHE